MIDLSFYDLTWCPRHGHPILVLQRQGKQGKDEYLAVAMLPEDAQALAITPTTAVAGRMRLYGLIEESVAGLGARLTDVELLIESDGSLRSSIRIEGRQGAVTLPAYFADGVILARRRLIPLRMSDETFARVRYLQASHAPHPQRPLPSPNRGADDRRLMGPFGPFIESLDFDGLGLAGPPAPGDQQAP